MDSTVADRRPYAGSQVPRRPLARILATAAISSSTKAIGMKMNHHLRRMRGGRSAADELNLPAEQSATGSSERQCAQAGERTAPATVKPGVRVQHAAARVGGGRRDWRQQHAVGGVLIVPASSVCVSTFVAHNTRAKRMPDTNQTLTAGPKLTSTLCSVLRTSL